MEHRTVCSLGAQEYYSITYFSQKPNAIFGNTNKRGFSLKYVNNNKMYHSNLAVITIVFGPFAEIV